MATTSIGISLDRLGQTSVWGSHKSVVSRHSPAGDIRVLDGVQRRKPPKKTAFRPLLVAGGRVGKVDGWRSGGFVVEDSIPLAELREGRRVHDARALDVRRSPHATCE